jgi:hypothetical protein
MYNSRFIVLQSMQGTFLTQMSQVCKQMLSLKDRCMSATTNKPYVKSIVGGLDNSPEGNQVRKHDRSEHSAEIAMLIDYHTPRPA